MLTKKVVFIGMVVVLLFAMGITMLLLRESNDPKSRSLLQDTNDPQPVDIGLCAKFLPPPTIEPKTTPTTEERLLDRVKQFGVVSVIVEINVEYTVEAEINETTSPEQRGRVNDARTQLIEELKNYNATVISVSDTWVIPFLALDVDEAALRYLMDSPLVKGIDENMVIGGVQPTLTPFVPRGLNSEEQQIYEGIEQFIAQLSLPAVQPTRYHCIPEIANLLFFTASWGSAQDCMAGCFYSSIVGAWNDGQIGLLNIEDYDHQSPHPDTQQLLANFKLPVSGPLADIEVVRLIKDYGAVQSINWAGAGIFQYWLRDWYQSSPETPPDILNLIAEGG